MKIEELMEMWVKDAVIDETEPGKELFRIPTLHSKYLKILSQHKLIVKKLLHDYNKLRHIKWQWLSGDLNNPEDLAKYKLEPNPKKIMRQDFPIYIDSDEELNNILLRKALNEEIVDFCTAVLKELHSRTFQIKSHIEWRRFTNGE